MATVRWRDGWAHSNGALNTLTSAVYKPCKDAVSVRKSCSRRVMARGTRPAFMRSFSRSWTRATACGSTRNRLIGNEDVSRAIIEQRVPCKLTAAA